MQNAGVGHLLQQFGSRRTICDLATGQKKGDGTAEAIGQGMDFRRAPASRMTDRLGVFPLLRRRPIDAP
jgi:hypothetical protein